MNIGWVSQYKTMNFQNKLRIAQTKVKVRQSWNEFKDFLLVLFLLNMLINLISGGDLVSVKNIHIGNANADTQATFSPNMEAVVDLGNATTSIPYGEIAEAKEIDEFTAEFSAYTASVEETDDDPFTMASGKKVYKGAIACPRHIELGTKIMVDGYGEFVCEDRMNVRYTNNFDIYVETKDEALKFGRKELTYSVIK